MTNRREFLQTAAALSAAPLASRAAFADPRTPLALNAVIYDSRHGAARDFGARAARHGAPVRAIEGDITDLWQRELLSAWKTSPIVVAGLTERPALFLLEQLAWEHGLRVVFEAEHDPAPRAAHRVVRAADTHLAAELRAAESAWPLALADALLQGRAAPSRHRGPTDAAMAAYIGEPTKLYSWIIAPRAAA